MSPTALQIALQLQDAPPPELSSLLNKLSQNSAHTFRTYHDDHQSAAFVWSRWRCIYGGNLSKKILFLFTPHLQQHRMILGAYLAAVKNLMNKGRADTSAYFEADAAISLIPFQPDFTPVLQGIPESARQYDAVIEVAPSYEGNRGLAILLPQRESLLVSTIQSFQPEIPVREDFALGSTLPAILGPKAEVIRLEVLIEVTDRSSTEAQLNALQNLFENVLPAYCQHGTIQRKVSPYVA